MAEEEQQRENEDATRRVSVTPQDAFNSISHLEKCFLRTQQQKTDNAVILLSFLLKKKKDPFLYIIVFLIDTWFQHSVTAELFVEEKETFQSRGDTEASYFHRFEMSQSGRHHDGLPEQHSGGKPWFLTFMGMFVDRMFLTP